MTFACKKCRKAFRKDAKEFEERYVFPVYEILGCCCHNSCYPVYLFLVVVFNLTKPISDEYCPHCDNHFVIDALTPKPALKVEGEDARIDSRYASSVVTREPELISRSECSKTTGYAPKRRGQYLMLGMPPTDSARALLKLLFY